MIDKGGRTYLGVAVGEKGAPVGLLEAIWVEKEVCYGRWMEGSRSSESRASLRTASCFMAATRPCLIWVVCLGLPGGLPETGLDGFAMAS